MKNNPIYLPWLTTSQHLTQHFHLHLNSEMSSQKCIEIYHIILHSKSLLLLLILTHENCIFLLRLVCQPSFLGIIHLKKSYVFVSGIRSHSVHCSFVHNLVLCLVMFHIFSATVPIPRHTLWTLDVTSVTINSNCQNKCYICDRVFRDWVHVVPSAVCV